MDVFTVFVVFGTHPFLFGRSVFFLFLIRAVELSPRQWPDTPTSGVSMLLPHPDLTLFHEYFSAQFG